MGESVHSFDSVNQFINLFIFIYRDEGLPLVVHFSLKFHPRLQFLEVNDLREVLKGNETIIDADSIRVQEGEVLTALMQVIIKCYVRV